MSVGKSHNQAETQKRKKIVVPKVVTKKSRAAEAAAQGFEAFGSLWRSDLQGARLRYQTKKVDLFWAQARFRMYAQCSSANMCWELHLFNWFNSGTVFSMDLNADGSASTNATTKKNASFKATAEIRLLSILIVPQIWGVAGINVNC